MKKVLFVILMFGTLLMASCKFSAEQPEQVYHKLVKTDTVVEVTSRSVKNFPAVIHESEELSLAFRVAGPIQKIYVKEGDYVKEGQLIAMMDPRDYKIQLQATEAQVNQLRSEYERVAELNKRNGVSDNDYEKMLAGKQMAEAKLKNARDQLNDTKLFAPFSGYITKVNFEEEELVNHGTAIASMIDVSLLKVEIKVPASLYIYRDSIVHYTCTQEDIADKIYPLTPYGHNVKANGNGLYTLYLYHQPSEDCLLAPGMNVNVAVTLSNAEQSRLSIPINAIAHSSEGDFVWVVNSDHKVARRMVSAGSDVVDGRVSVTKGLKAGEQIVLGGLHLLKEGESVRVVEPKSETNIGNLL